MLTIRTHSVIMTILMAMTLTASSDYLANQSCSESSHFYVNTTQECSSNPSIALEQFKPSHPH